MSIRDKISAVLGFRPGPVSILTFLSYLAVLVSILVTSDRLPNVPKNQKGLSLDEAYADLHNITQHPHPYNSHANEQVHSHLLAKISSIADQYSYSEVVEDTVSNGSWSSTAGIVVYFEGTNIIARINGTDEDEDNQAVLFSAHYDSVSTGNGATDDGMGVVTLIQLFEYFSKNRPRRTAIFNINNGEEDYLNGAHAFLEHPWSKETTSFLNLEGASSGGRPILFRATSTPIMYAFHHDNVRHPHANVLSADAFARRLIRSETDYAVYQANGLEGADLAFYRGRSKYHTKYDAVPYTDGQEKSLWSMMESAHGAAHALLNDDKTHQNNGQGDTPVFFDVFGTLLFVFPLRSLFVFNIVTLVLGPLLLLLLTAIEIIIIRRRVEASQRQGLVKRGWQSFKSLSWLRSIWKWSAFWLALAVTIVLESFLIRGYLAFNPFIVYSSPNLVLASLFSLSYLILLIVLLIPLFIGLVSSTGHHAFLYPDTQKQILFVQLYFLTWALLLAATIISSKWQIGGVYYVTIWNVLVWGATAIGIIESMFGGRGSNDVEEQFYRTNATGSGATYAHEDMSPPTERPEGEMEGEVERSSLADPDATERTPLLAALNPEATKEVQRKAQDGAIGWWILQFLVSVPVPIILVGHIGSMLATGMAQSLADGSDAITIYAALAVVSILLILPITPFIFQLHSRLTLLVLVVFIASTTYTWLVFPFSIQAPLKVFFQQTVTFSNNTSEAAKVRSKLTGVDWYLENELVGRIPSSRGKDMECFSEKAKPGLTTCMWDTSELTPLPSSGDPLSRAGASSSTSMKDKNATIDASPYFSASVSRVNSTFLQFSITPTNSRNCRIYFSSSSDSGDEKAQNVTHFVARAPDGTPPSNNGTLQSPLDGPIKEIRLWSRTWDRDFLVDIYTQQPSASSGLPLNGTIACEWVEYESGTIGLPVGGAKIPAFEEVLGNLPQWAVASKVADGLVEVTAEFSI